MIIDETYQWRIAKCQIVVKAQTRDLFSPNKKRCNVKMNKNQQAIKSEVFKI